MSFNLDFFILVNHKIGELDVEYSWQRVRLFDELFCRVLYERCQENSTASVLKVTKKPKSKWRPVPLDTIVSNKIPMNILLCEHKFIYFNS